MWWGFPGKKNQGDEFELRADAPDDEAPVSESALATDENLPVVGNIDGSTEETEEDLNVDVFESELDATVGQGYDLEQGQPLSEVDERDRRPSRKTRAIESPKEFFSVELLYRYDILEDPQREYHRGSFRFDIKGQNGGVWTIVIGDDLQVVNERQDADLLITAGVKDFLTVVNGEINPQLAILAGKLKFHGDLRRGVRLLELIAPEDS